MRCEGSASVNVSSQPAGILRALQARSRKVAFFGAELFCIVDARGKCLAGTVRSDMDFDLVREANRRPLQALDALGPRAPRERIHDYVRLVGARDVDRIHVLDREAHALAVL